MILYIVKFVPGNEGYFGIASAIPVTQPFALLLKPCVMIVTPAAPAVCRDQTKNPPSKKIFSAMQMDDRLIGAQNSPFLEKCVRNFS